MKHRFWTIGVALLVSLPLFAQEPRHLFHASALAVEGRADGHEIARQAGVVLPESGGSLSQRVEQFDDGVVRFAEAISEVTGIERDGVAITRSSVSIRDIDIMGVVHADRIVLRTTARQGIDDAEATFSFAGSRIDGLTVRGEPVDVAIDTQRFNRASTFGQLREKVRSEREGFAIERAGSISDSIVRSINLASLGSTKGYALPIEGVGTLYLGHVIVKPGERRLAMIRIDLGRRGMIGIGVNDTNGETVP
ncbi:MAG: choice-of-anchor P family protein [Acidobacteriota bacterium]